MVQETAPLRRHLGALGKMQRRKRIFARLREGAGYEEIAAVSALIRTELSFRKRGDYFVANLWQVVPIYPKIKPDVWELRHWIP
jgi:hypothetical protein